MAKKAADLPPLPPPAHQVPMLPCTQTTTLFPRGPYLFHADHFADADVQPGRDNVLWLRVLGAFLCRLWGARGTVAAVSTNPGSTQ